MSYIETLVVFFVLGETGQFLQFKVGIGISKESGVQDFSTFCVFFKLNSLTEERERC